MQFSGVISWDSVAAGLYSDRLLEVSEGGHTSGNDQRDDRVFRGDHRGPVAP
jgi:hypothetical protein